MAGLPSGVRDDVLKAVYQRLDDWRWEELPGRAASEAYGRLVEDPQIGGVLAPYMAAEEIRVWLKDGACKEYRRSLEGVSTYAKYTSRRYPGASAVVTAAFGADWRPTGDPTEKPMRTEAVSGGGDVGTVLWGRFTTLRDMFWTAAQIRVGDAQRSVAIVVTRPSQVPLPADKWTQAEALGELIGVKVTGLVYPVTWKPTSAT